MAQERPSLYIVEIVKIAAQNCWLLVAVFSGKDEKLGRIELTSSVQAG